MKRIVILVSLLACLLSGCGRDETTAAQWFQALDGLIRQENYTVEEITVTPEETIRRYRQYDLIYAKTEEPGETLYFCAEDGICYGIGWVEDPGIWVKQQIETSDLYFYDYTLLDRLNRISGYVDMGLLEYREADSTFVGSNLNSAYVYRDLEHTPLLLEVAVENGRIVKIHEVWHCTRDGEDLGIYEDTVVLSDFSTTQVRLPGDTIEAGITAAE